MPTLGEIERCPHCGSITSLRKISLYIGLLKSLHSVYQWCLKRGVHDFTTAEIRGLLGQVSYTRFGDLVMFGGLVYKHKKASYGLNMERCQEFFAGIRMIPGYVMKNPITGEIQPHDYKKFHEFPHLSQFLDEQKQFVAEYQPNQS